MLHPMLIFLMAMIGSAYALLSGAITLWKAHSRAELVRRNITLLMNHPQVSVALAEPEPDSSPVYALITRCPATGCGAEGAHLVLGLTDTHADRQCVECDHTWKERRSA